MKFKINIFHFIFFIQLISLGNLNHLRRILETEVPTGNIIQKIKYRKYADLKDELDSIEYHCEKSDAKYFIYLVNGLNYDVSSILNNKINFDNAVSLQHPNLNFYIKLYIKSSNYYDQ